MKNRLKMLIAALGVTALVISQYGVIQVNAEEEPVTDETVQEEDKEDNSDSPFVLAATNLKWNEKRQGTFYNPNEKAVNFYVHIYYNGKDLHEEDETIFYYEDNQSTQGNVTIDFYHLIETYGKSGTYQFAVQAIRIGNAGAIKSSWSALSDELIYESPSDQLSKPDLTVSESDVVVKKVEEWKPTTPDEKKRYAAFGKEKVEYAADNGNAYTVKIQNAMQGKNCFASFEAVLMDWDIGRTYNIFPSGKVSYKMDEKTNISLGIPKALQADGRAFKMICVTEGGQAIILEDLDSDPNTITFETDTFYAFALVYKDTVAAK